MESVETMVLKYEGRERKWYETIIQVEHQIYPEWGIGNVYDVMPRTDMALVAFENVDTENRPKSRSGA